MTDRILNEEEVVDMTALSKSTILRLENDGHFPKRLKISKRRVGWRLSDIQTWIHDTFGKDED